MIVLKANSYHYRKIYKGKIKEIVGKGSTVIKLDCTLKSEAMFKAQIINQYFKRAIGEYKRTGNEVLLRNKVQRFTKLQADRLIRISTDVDYAQQALDEAGQTLKQIRPKAYFLKYIQQAEHDPSVMQAVQSELGKLNEQQFPMLSKAIEEFKQYKIDQGEWNDNTPWPTYNLTWEILINLVHDKPIDTVTRDDVLRFKEAILLWPKRVNQDPKYKHLDLKQIFELEVEDDDVIGKTSAKMHLDRVKQMLYHTEQSYDVVYKLKNIQIKKDETSYRPFTNDEVKLVLKNLNSLDQTVQDYVRVGLYHGFRLREIKQLEVKHDEETGIDYFQLADAKVKNEQSNRNVPVHTSCNDIIPRMPFKRVSSGHVSKSFNALLTELGIKKSRAESFHSLRSTCASAISHEVNPVVISRVLGHTVKETTFKVYRKRESLVALNEAVQSIDY